MEFMFLISIFAPSSDCPSGPDRNVTIATQLAFLHFGVAHLAINQDLFE